MQKLSSTVTLFCFVFFLQQAFCRSPLRKINHAGPHITIQWAKGSKLYLLRDSILEFTPLFGLYDKNHVSENLLPEGPLSFKYEPEKSVTGKELADLAEHLLTEIREKKKVYRDFIILKDRDFNLKKQTGLFIAKCKHFPFVIKLFMETPRSFIRPYNKGFEPACFFICSGGATRHFLGFTRIKNLEEVRKRIEKNPHWSPRVSFPRKWFWIPKENNLLELTGYNIGGHDRITIQVPSVYAIIADEIHIERDFKLRYSNDKNTAIDLSNYLLCKVDPHIKNFVVEKETGKIGMIDTEHFPSMVGYKKRPRITSYLSWYLELTMKFLKQRLFTSKKERLALQKNPIPPLPLN